VLRFREKFDKNSLELLDVYWQSLVVAVIGEVLDDGDEITGVCFARRKQGDRLEVWTRRKDNQAWINQLKKRLLKVVFEDADQCPFFLEYNPHDAHSK